MPDYRLCCVDEEGSLASEEIIHARSDGEAIGIALDLNRAAQCELWQDARFVAAIGANKCTGSRTYRFDYEL
jgi:hypothetical protein